MRIRMRIQAFNQRPLSDAPALALRHAAKPRRSAASSEPPSWLPELRHWRVGLTDGHLHRIVHFPGVCAAYLDDDEYLEQQQFLMLKPDAGQMVPGSGGARKLR